MMGTIDKSIIKNKKEELRKECRNYLFSMEPSYKTSADKTISIKLLENNHLNKAKTIMIYLAKDEEVETRPIIEKMLEIGKKILVPVIATGNIDAVRLKDLNNLQIGQFAIAQPKYKAEDIVSPEDIDLVVLPGLCFTRSGKRIGRGKGYFDKFLTKLSINTYKIALCYSKQIYDDISCEDHDICVDEVITE